jgi:hypothetical protein
VAADAGVAAEGAVGEIRAPGPRAPAGSSRRSARSAMGRRGTRGVRPTRAVTFFGRGDRMAGGRCITVELRGLSDPRTVREGIDPGRSYDELTTTYDNLRHRAPGPAGAAPHVREGA